MEVQIGIVLHWSNQKEPEQAKSKDEVIRMNLDRIHNSAATPLPSNPSRHSQVNLLQIKWKTKWVQSRIGVIRRNPKQRKSKYEVIMRNLDRIHISSATPLPSNLSRHSQVSLIKKKKKKNPDSKNSIIMLRDHVADRITLMSQNIMTTDR